MTRFPLVIAVSLFLAFLLGVSTLAYAESDWQKAKNEFSDEFQEFKRDGLSAQEVEQLTEKLLDAAGDDIDGTGLKALLEAMNRHPERAARMLDEKADVEKLIDMVGTTSALVNADDPIDEMVDVYNSIADDMRDFADGVDEVLPGHHPVARLLDATATQLEIRKKSIKTIAERTKTRNDAINSYDSWVSGESNNPPPTSSLELEWEDTPTEKEIEWEKLREEEKAQNEACMERCSKEYLAYTEIAITRARARTAAAATSEALDQARSKANNKRVNYNNHARQFNAYLGSYRITLAKRDAEKERMVRAQRENRLAAAEGLKQIVNRLEESLTTFRKTLQDDLTSLKRLEGIYVQFKIDFQEIQEKYKIQIREYKRADSLYRVAIKNYDDCVAACYKVSERPRRSCGWLDTGMVSDHTADDDPPFSFDGDIPLPERCHAGYAGNTATCWDGRIIVHPGSPGRAWCTYKHIPKSAYGGGGAPGKVYECVCR